jgi:hypothetical protein
MSAYMDMVVRKHVAHVISHSNLDFICSNRYTLLAALFGTQRPEACNDPANTQAASLFDVRFIPRVVQRCFSGSTAPWPRGLPGFAACLAHLDADLDYQELGRPIWAGCACSRCNTLRWTQEAAVSRSGYTSKLHEMFCVLVFIIHIVRCKA